MSKPFFDLRATHNPNRWFLPLSDQLCVGPAGSSFMFGGVGMAAAIQAMQRTCDRPVVWATGQYLSYARPPSVVDLDVWVPAHGAQTTQARVIGRVGEGEIFTVNAALGRRQSEVSRQWATMPDVPPPEDCESSEHWRGGANDLHSRIEVRTAQGRYGRDRDGTGQRALPAAVVEVANRILMVLPCHDETPNLTAVVRLPVRAGDERRAA